MILTNEVRTALEKGLNYRRLLLAAQMSDYAFSHKIEHWAPFAEAEAKAIMSLIKRHEREIKMLEKQSKTE